MFTFCQIAWALNKGIKAEFKQYWDVELGVTYIPWSKVREDQLEELKDGGILDVDTLSPGKNTHRPVGKHKQIKKKMKHTKFQWSPNGCFLRHFTIKRSFLQFHTLHLLFHFENC